MIGCTLLSSEAERLAVVQWITCSNQVEEKKQWKRMIETCHC